MEDFHDEAEILPQENEDISQEFDTEADAWVSTAEQDFADVQAHVDGPPPPVVVPPEDQTLVDHAVCRVELDAFFEMRVHGRVQTMRWLLRDNLPRRGRDTEFDALLVKLGILNKRSYQSQRWLAFNKAKGIVPPPQYKMENSEELLDTILASIQPEVIVELATVHTASRKEYSENSMQYSNIARSPLVKAYLLQELVRLAHWVCEQVLRGATPTTITSRAGDHIIDYRWRWRKACIKFVLEKFPTADSQQKIGIRIFFGDLHQEMCSEWERRVKALNCPPMDDDVDYSMLQSRLEGSEDTVYYLSGWLLFKLRSATRLRGLSPVTLSTFCNRNDSANLPRIVDMPSSEVNYRDQGSNALLRPGAKWFAFVCLLESLYLVNMTAVQVLHHRGRIFERITAVTRSSLPLRERFSACIPPEFDNEQRKSLWRAYYLLILPAYGKMKSGDMVRLLRNARPASRADKLPTRLNAIVAHESAKC